ncbi:MAG: hypothetical protein JETT_1882 [Candidatus Jettenia ecosi]|uniref:Uncharacterized protein n=1 Tax=Candidatus Jettenia ecosi TaxID=2494326 RepID=A0A533QAX5_9BACT|nr:MAG: hypothetical protein JETT_1882 [Candidatus Jettenia ecosi]
MATISPLRATTDKIAKSLVLHRLCFCHKGAGLKPAPTTTKGILI